MKVLGKSSLSSKMKRLMDIMWYGGLVAYGLWFVVLLFVLSLNSVCTKDSKCISSATVDNVGFKMDSKSSQFRSTEGTEAFFAEGSGKLQIKGQLDRPMTFAMFIEGLLFGFLFLFSVWNLRKLFKTFAEGAPFTATNIRTLKLIAVSIFSLSLSSSLFSSINAYLLNQQFIGEGMQLVADGDISISSLFAAVVIYILAEIFRLGSQLEDEKAQTV